MARPLRLEYEGALYHVTGRGDDRRKIYFREGDYRKFLEYVAEAKKRYGILLHCYVLMSNHYHLLLETLRANLSRAIHYINGSYTTWINRKDKRSGHLFQGRYKAILVDKDSYLLELSRYLHLNPVRAGIVKRPEDYPYSSYRAYKSDQRDSLVTRGLILGVVSPQEAEAQKGYRAYVEGAIGEELESPLKHLYGGMILGSERFIQETRKRIKGEQLATADVSHRRELQTHPEMEDILDLVAKEYRIPKGDLRASRPPEPKKAAIYLLKKHTAATNQEIGKLFGGLSYSAVAKVYRRFEEEMERNGGLRKRVERMVKELSHVKG